MFSSNAHFDVRTDRVARERRGVFRTNRRKSHGTNELIFNVLSTEIIFKTRVRVTFFLYRNVSSERNLCVFFYFVYRFVRIS